jgi:hypothetical protein
MQVNLAIVPNDEIMDTSEKDANNNALFLLSFFLDNACVVVFKVLAWQQ